MDAALRPAAGGESEQDSIGALADLLADPATPVAVLEQRLLTKLLQDFLIILRPLAGAEREFIVYGLHWYELTNLKVMLCGKFSSLPAPAIQAQLIDLSPLQTLPIEDLLGTEDAAELLRRLEKTPYADIARQARRAYAERPDLFAVDAAIDRRYFMGLYDHARAVGRPQRPAVVALTEQVLNRISLVWLLRFRFAYGLSPAESYYVLTPSAHGLTSERLQALAKLGSLEEVLAALPAGMQRWLGAATTILEVEDRLEKMLQDTCRRVLEDLRIPLARAFAYLLLRGIEMQQILAILKGRRLQADPALIRRAARLEGPGREPPGRIPFRHPRQEMSWPGIGAFPP